MFVWYYHFLLLNHCNRVIHVTVLKQYTWIIQKICLPKFNNPNSCIQVPASKVKAQIPNLFVFPNIFYLNIVIPQLGYPEDMPIKFYNGLDFTLAGVKQHAHVMHRTPDVYRLTNKSCIWVGCFTNSININPCLVWGAYCKLHILKLHRSSRRNRNVAI